MCGRKTRGSWILSSPNPRNFEYSRSLDEWRKRDANGNAFATTTRAVSSVRPARSFSEASIRLSVTKRPAIYRSCFFRERPRQSAAGLAVVRDRIDRNFAPTDGSVPNVVPTSAWNRTSTTFAIAIRDQADLAGVPVPSTLIARFDERWDKFARAIRATPTILNRRAIDRLLDYRSECPSVHLLATRFNLHHRWQSIRLAVCETVRAKVPARD